MIESVKVIAPLHLEIVGVRIIAGVLYPVNLGVPGERRIVATLAPVHRMCVCPRHPHVEREVLVTVLVVDVGVTLQVLHDQVVIDEEADVVRGPVKLVDMRIIAGVIVMVDLMALQATMPISVTQISAE